jgi:putative membrane protein
MSGFALASLNASLNFTAFVLMGVGFAAIRAGQKERHKRFMLAAFCASCAFLASYLTRIVLYGDTKFLGEGAMRVVYFAVLISHVLLALATAPLVLTTLFHAHKGNFVRHKAVARWTLPIWAYVSVTGVVVYVMLYHFG